MNAFRTRLFVAVSTILLLAPPVRCGRHCDQQGLGADAEVRDHQPATNFGASTELATRILDNFAAGMPATATTASARCT